MTTIILKKSEREYLEQYIKHAFQEEITYMGHQVDRLTGLPVCPRCERLALGDTRPTDTVRRHRMEDGRMMPNVTCPHCGYHGPGLRSLRDHVIKEFGLVPRGRKGGEAIANALRRRQAVMGER